MTTVRYVMACRLLKSAQISALSAIRCVLGFGTLEVDGDTMAYDERRGSTGCGVSTTITSRINHAPAPATVSSETP